MKIINSHDGPFYEEDELGYLGGYGHQLGYVGYGDGAGDISLEPEARIYALKITENNPPRIFLHELKYSHENH